ncbi:Regulator of G-protein signaling 6 [Aix galericulata]|nr:Regulator of G-protein signaling 6 [Aix galericulata]
MAINFSYIIFNSADIVQWLMKNLSIEDPGEAIHLGSLIAAQGYVFPISDHVLTLKDDGTFYRFQVAIYLCKRTMQNKARLELADYEAENLARLQRAFARKWEFIFMQAEAQVKIDRKKDKTERKILDSQERAFWDVHRPVPGCVNTTEMDIRKCRRMKNPQKVKKSVYGVTEESQPQSPVHVPSQPVRKTTKEDFRKQITFLNLQIDRHCLKMSKVAESLIAYTEQYVEYDPFITPAEPSNPWISDDAALWDIEMSKEPSQQRVKRWGFSMDEVLKDPVGRDQFLRFLESEFSSENLRFWLAVQDLKKQPLQDVTTRVEEIWQEFLAPGAQSAINLDSHSYEKTSQNVKDPGRYTYEDAQVSFWCVPQVSPTASRTPLSHESAAGGYEIALFSVPCCCCSLQPCTALLAQSHFLLLALPPLCPHELCQPPWPPSPSHTPHPPAALLLLLALPATFTCGTFCHLGAGPLQRRALDLKGLPWCGHKAAVWSGVLAEGQGPAAMV